MSLTCRPRLNTPIHYCVRSFLSTLSKPLPFYNIYLFFTTERNFPQFQQIFQKPFHWVTSIIILLFFKFAWKKIHWEIVFRVGNTSDWIFIKFRRNSLLLELKIFSKIIYEICLKSNEIYEIMTKNIRRISGINFWTKINIFDCWLLIWCQFLNI